MKKIPCSYKDCGKRRKHWTKPDELREPRMVEVPDDHQGPIYCSIECAAYAGALSKTE